MYIWCFFLYLVLLVPGTPGQESGRRKENIVNRRHYDIPHIFSFVAQTIGAIFSPCSQLQADIILVMDSSYTISHTTYNHAIQNFGSQFITNMLSVNYHNHIGAVEYFGRSNSHIQLNEAQSLADLVHKLQRKFFYHGSTTDMRGALHNVRTEMFRGYNGDRSNIQNVVVLISDGEFYHSQDAIREASNLKNDGALIYTVAVGDKHGHSDFSVLNAISSFGTSVQLDHTYGERTANTISQQICTGLALNHGSQSASIQPLMTQSSLPTHQSTTPPSTLTTASTTVCVDVDTNCALYTQLACVSNKAYTAKYCAKFCGLCSGVPTPTLPTTTTTLRPTTTAIPTPPIISMNGICTDKLINCPQYGPTVCTQYASWAAGNCRKYCGFCSGSMATPPLPISTTQSTTTTTQPTTTTTSKTTTQTTQSSCVDVDSNCSNYGSKMCTTLPAWAKINCSKYCSFCQTPTKQTHWLAVPSG